MIRFMSEMLIKRRTELFCKDSIPAHILNKDGDWFNGYVLTVHDDYFDFLDRKKGKIPLFFADIATFDFFRGDLSTLKKHDKQMKGGSTT